MKIWIISDTHGYHTLLEAPDVDMVIHCGDEANHPNPAMNQHESYSFFDWYRNLPIKHKIFVPGNHSTAIEAGMVLPSDYPEIKFLIHELCEIEGIRIFGSPYTPKFCDWAYMHKRNRMQAVWENLPECDILVTHGPPKGILDLTRDKDNGSLVQVGCKSLYNKVMELKPKIHAFGHVHTEKDCYNTAVLQRSGITFVNAACLSHTKEFYRGSIIEISSVEEV